jgi:hypothetical protein
VSDHWNFYLTRIDGDLASISLDLGIAQDPPCEQYPNIVWVRVHLLRPRPDGLSSQEEFDDLLKVDDVLEAAIAPVGGVYVGRKTGNGVRDFFFYAADGDSVRAAAAAALKVYPDYKHESGERPDPDWRVYFDVLYPPPVELQCMGNRDVLASLERSGDPGEKPRMIEHWIHFSDELSRRRYLDQWRTEGFSEINSYENEEGDRRFVLVLGRVDAPARIDDVNIPMFESASAAGAVYDGWETLLLKPDAQ